MVTLKRAHVFISGKVQGVYFRKSTKEKADALGVTGWVKNLSDGRVEAVFEGEKEDITEMLKFCNEGPEMAVVEEVDLEWEEPTGFGSFNIRR